MKNLLNSVKLVRPNSSVFDLSHSKAFTANMGWLYPIMNVDCVPGDRWKISHEALVRLLPMVAPAMQRMNIRFESFFVPYRLLWENWQNFIEGVKVGSPAIDPAVPFFNLKTEGVYTVGGLSDHLGLPYPADNDTHVSAFMHAAYQFIWNEYYRDQNLQAPIDFELTDGDNTARAAFFDLQKRCWGADVFTKALPFAQRGDAVELPLGQFQDTPIKASDESLTGPFASWLANDDGTPIPNMIVPVDHPNPATGLGMLYSDNSNLIAAATTIREFRRAEKLQEFMERSALGGNRYKEMIYVMFGESAGDARLQRPEYIYGSSSPISIGEVLQTSESNTTPQGNMAGHGLGIVNGHNGFYKVREHGCIMCIASIIPTTGYFQGVPKNFLKVDDRYQYFWPQFEHIGEQEIFNKEVVASHNTPNGVFGYTPRYVEYKTATNKVAGHMKDSLMFWTQVRDLPNDVALNDTFVASDPSNRIFAVTDPDVDHLIIHVVNKVTARRLMSKYSTPHL